MTAPLPPGKLGLPWIGETMSIARNNHQFYRDHFAKYGPIFKTRLFGFNFVIVSGHEAFHQFATDPRVERGGTDPVSIEQMFFRSLALVDGDEHHMRKDVMLHAVRTREAMASYLDEMQRVWGAHVDRWERDGSATLRPDLTLASAQITGALYTGDESEAHIAELNEILAAMRYSLQILPIPIPGTPYAKALKGRKRLDVILKEAIAEHQRHPEKYDDIVSRMVAAAPEHGVSYDKLFGDVRHLIFAGQAGFFVPFILLTMVLAQRPDLRERAREEVLAVSPEGPITMEQIDQLTFLGQLSKEVRRMFAMNSATFFGKATADMEIGGYQVPKDWGLIGAIHITMRNADEWADPDTFDPDRFTAEREAALPPGSYVPHGGRGAQPPPLPRGGHGHDRRQAVPDAAAAQAHLDVARPGPHLHQRAVPAAEVGPAGHLRPRERDGAVVKAPRLLVLSKLMVVGARLPLTRTPAEAGLAFEDVSFTSTDDVELKGWFVPADDTGKPAPTVLFVHGWLWNRMGNVAGRVPFTDRDVDFLPPTKTLHDAGFNVLLFDLSNHGESGRRLPMTFGPLEARDYVGAVRYLRTRPDVDGERIGAVGTSMGGNVALIGSVEVLPIKALLARAAHAAVQVLREVLRRRDGQARLPQPPADRPELSARPRAPRPSTIDPGVYAAQLTDTQQKYVQGTGDPWGTMQIVQDFVDASPNALPAREVPVHREVRGLPLRHGAGARRRGLLRRVPVGMTAGRGGRAATVASPVRRRAIPSGARDSASAPSSTSAQGCQRPSWAAWRVYWAGSKKRS